LKQASQFILLKRNQQQKVLHQLQQLKHLEAQLLKHNQIHWLVSQEWACPEWVCLEWVCLAWVVSLVWVEWADSLTWQLVVDLQAWVEWVE